MAYTYAELREGDVVRSWNDSSLNKNVSEIAEKLQISSKDYKASVFGRNGQSTTPFWHRFKTKKDIENYGISEFNKKCKESKKSYCKYFRPWFCSYNGSFARGAFGFN